MNKDIKIILLYVLFTFGTFGAASARSHGESSFAAADSLYRVGNFKEAAVSYKQQLQAFGPSAPVYYNLGNCYYKLDEIPQCILCYERAAVLDPSDADIQANLLLARSKTVDKVVPPSEMFFITWWRSFTHFAAMDEWALIAIVSFVLMLVGVVFYLFMSDDRWKKIGFYGALTFLLLCVLSNGCVFTQYRMLVYRNNAVVMTPAVTVRSAPSESAMDLFVMHGGARVEILDRSMKHWCEVKLEEGKQGWVPVKSLEVI